MRYRDLDKRVIKSLTGKYNVSEYFLKLDILKVMHEYNKHVEPFNLDVKQETILFTMLVLSRLASNEVLSLNEMRSLLIQTIKDFEWDGVLSKDLFQKTEKPLKQSTTTI